MSEVILDDEVLKHSVKVVKTALEDVLVDRSPSRKAITVHVKGADGPL